MFYGNESPVEEPRAYQNTTANGVTQASPIHRAYSDLEDGIMKAQKVAEDLRDRLAPVLAEPVPMPEVGLAKSGRGSSTLAGMIGNDTARIQRVTDVLSDILTRLEL